MVYGAAQGPVPDAGESAGKFAIPVAGRESDNKGRAASRVDDAGCVAVQQGARFASAAVVRLRLHEHRL